MTDELATLRTVSRRMQEEHGPDHERHAMWAAMSDWLHTAGADLWAHGPLCECGTGCDACDDNLWEPHVRAALAVARAYPPALDGRPGGDS